MARERIDHAAARGEDDFERSQRLRKELALDLKIDKTNLDEELVHQPELYHKAGEEYTTAASFRDRVKADRDEISSTIDFEIRRDAAKAQNKPTEPAIKQMIAGDDRYRDAQRDYQDWEREAARWSALREDFHTRGFALRELVTLWVAGYYQTNSVTREARDRRAEEVGSRRRELVGQDRHRSRED